MPYYLIDQTPRGNNRIGQEAAALGDTFEVSPDYHWVESDTLGMTEHSHSFDGKTFSARPPRVATPNLVDPTPGTLDIVAMLIDLGVKKRNGKPLTQADLPEEWQELMAP